ncbi:MAG: cation:proton antiporter regulatory subunit [Acidimicrobiales bacterium]
MTEVRETKLPGVGVRYEFTTDIGQDMGVIVHHDGRREVLVYDGPDPDSCSSIVSLSEADTQTLGEILGVSHVTETVAAVRHEIEGLAIEWVELPTGSSAIGSTIGDGAYRTETGASIVAVIRGNRTVPAPGPDFTFSGGDVAVAVGTLEGLAALRNLLNS